jgi:hypothetical protein
MNSKKFTYVFSLNAAVYLFSVPGILYKTAALPVDWLYCVDASKAERTSQQSRWDCSYHASLHPCKICSIFLVQDKEKYSECITFKLSSALQYLGILCHKLQLYFEKSEPFLFGGREFLISWGGIWDCTGPVPRLTRWRIDLKVSLCKQQCINTIFTWVENNSESNATTY